MHIRYMYKYACMYIIYNHIYIYVYTCIYTCIYVYAYIYIYTYIYIYMNRNGSFPAKLLGPRGNPLLILDGGVSEDFGLQNETAPSRS